MNIIQGFVNGFKSIDWLARKIHKLQDKILIPLIKKFWPKKITPNMLTSLRLAIAFLIIFLALEYSKYRILIINLFIFASLLDLIDGPIARALHMETKLGGYLDPLSDKILICPLLIIFIWPYSSSLVIAIVSIEIFLLLIASLALFKKIYLSANIWGKWKMFFQVFGLVFIFFQQMNIGINLIWIAAGLGISSILGYLNPVIKYIFKPLNK